ncbi:hypothetical protein [Jiangella alba]|uniref:Uncharacterized protein n=1 Tax=Jiangella alba TaxID=561176 RepID=A0A1H5PT56_9ACTN|nr:hypothetical protein [Jiangella alba]SEF17052.1 hypothetical protein SAMN04488561_5675 [Jiangella alba]
MHRGRAILGAVVGGSLAVAAALQVASWTSEPTGWSDYRPDPPPRTPTPRPLSADATASPECLERIEAALRTTDPDEPGGATAYACAADVTPAEPCVPETFLLERPGRPPEYVQSLCE